MRTLIVMIAMLSYCLQTYAQSATVLPEEIFFTAENEVSLNSKYSEFGVNRWSNKLSFTTNRNQFSERNEFIGNASYDIYTYDQSKKYRQVSPLASLNTKVNVGSATQIVGGKFYYTAENNKADYNLKAATVERTMIIYEASQIDGRWKTSPVKAFRDKKFSCTHPSLSKNGRTIFFASDMPGGFGGMDIYKSQLVNGEWSEPVNLGPLVNTAENELFPFIHESGFLFFSSNGHKGFGGMDIYVTEFEESAWKSPENMGSPVNTPANDFSIYVDRNFSNGYFSSDREGGMGSDDIYKLAIRNAPAGKELVSENVAIPVEEVETEVLATAPKTYVTDQTNTSTQFQR